GSPAMILATDVGPLLARLEDVSPAVRLAAVRAIAALSAIEPLDNSIAPLLKRADPAGRAAIPIAWTPHDGQTVLERRRSEISAETPFGTPEQWRRNFREARSIEDRFRGALALATVGETEYVTTVLEEAERLPLTFSLIRLARECLFEFSWGARGLF